MNWNEKTWIDDPHDEVTHWIGRLEYATLKKYEQEKVVAVQQYIIALQKDISDLEWDGEYKKADNLKKRNTEGCHRK